MLRDIGKEVVFYSVYWGLKGFKEIGLEDKYVCVV